MTVTNTPQTEQAAPTVQEQAKTVLGHVAGYMGHRTIATGLATGLVAAVDNAPEGATAADLADRLDLDGFFVSVWCRAAFAAGVLERVGHGYRLAPQMATLLLDETSPAYAGGLFPLALQPEMFDGFEKALSSGERLWWDETSPDWIAGVAGTGRPFYTRLVPGGLAQVPGLVERLDAGCTIVDTACGAGVGVVRLAEFYPSCRVIGVDGDAHSIEKARRLAEESGVGDRVSFVCSPLEDFELDEPVTAIINNISMHECRDIDRVAENVRTALEPGGWFVISDFPFPDTDEGLRSVPGRIMCGIQFFEAQIDDQLLPRTAYDELLTRHGFGEIGNFTLSPVHAVTYGRAT